MIDMARDGYERRHEHVNHRMRGLAFAFMSVCIAFALGMGWLNVHLEKKHEAEQLRQAVWQEMVEQHLELIRPDKPDYRFYRDI